MAKKKEKSAKEKAADVVEIVVEEESSAEENGRNWSEELEDAGREVKGFLKNAWTEGNIRRVVVRNEAGDTILNIPVAVGALGLIPPLTGPVVGVSVLGAAIAMATKCTINIERRDVDKNVEAA